jgi:hypothetical protein
MTRRILYALLGLAPAYAGCYHATVVTGATPSTVTVEKHWASAWIGGLVAPKTVETAQQCSTGVARIETQLSFVNMLVGLITLSIYTPMDIVVTCAQGAKGGTAFVVPPGATPEQWTEAVTAAAQTAKAQGEPAYVRIGQQGVTGRGPAAVAAPHPRQRSDPRPG